MGSAAGLRQAGRAYGHVGIATRRQDEAGKELAAQALAEKERLVFVLTVVTNRECLPVKFWRNMDEM